MSNPYKLFRLPNGPYLERNDESGYLNSGWDDLFREKDLYGFLGSVELTKGDANLEDCLAPIEGQEVWACGVTYRSSRLARMEESKDAGGGDFYSRVYSAGRPEIFFKSTSAIMFLTLTI